MYRKSDKEIAMGTRLVSMHNFIPFLWSRRRPNIGNHVDGSGVGISFFLVGVVVG